MISIGLIGESENDVKAIRHLLEQRYAEGFRYSILLRNLPGDHLDSAKAKKVIPLEVRKHRPDVLLVIRDADATENDRVSINKKKEWHAEIVKGIHAFTKSVFLLNVFELEALILADIEQFNSHYNLAVNGVKFQGNVSLQEKPKEFLQREARKRQKEYHVNHCPDLFKALRIDTVSRNCSYFREFLVDFEHSIANIG